MLVRVVRHQNNVRELSLQSIEEEIPFGFLNMGVVELRETDNVAIPQRGEEIPIERGPAYNPTSLFAKDTLNPKANYPISVIAGALYAVKNTEEEHDYLPCIFQTNQGDVVVFTKAGLDEHHRILDENRQKSEDRAMSVNRAFEILGNLLQQQNDIQKQFLLIFVKSFEDAMTRRGYKLPDQTSVAIDAANQFINDYFNK